MATRRTSHSRKHRTLRSRKHRTLRQRRTHRSRRGGAGNSLNPTAAAFQPGRVMLRRNAPAFVPAPRNSGPLPNGNAAAAEYNRRSNGMIMVPSNGTVARMEYNNRTQGATIMKPYNGVFNRR